MYSRLVLLFIKYTVDVYRCNLGKLPSSIEGEGLG